MTLALGCLLGAGLLLALSPALWPAGPDRASTAPGAGQRMRSRLAQAGLGALPLPVFLAISVVLSLAAGGLAETLLGIRALTVVATVLGLALPALIVSSRAHARVRVNCTVWPDVVDHLVSALRSGLSLPDSVSSLAQAGPADIRSAFGQFERDYRSTGNFGYSVDALKGALADPIADRILETLRMAREVGGSDLTVVLRHLAAWLRQDAAIRGEVEARQSWIVTAARLGVAAPWIILLLLVTRPEAGLAYNTPAGIGVIIGGLLVSVIAYRIMIRLGRLPEDHRWLG